MMFRFDPAASLNPEREVLDNADKFAAAKSELFSLDLMLRHPALREPGAARPAWPPASAASR